MAMPFVMPTEPGAQGLTSYSTICGEAPENRLPGGPAWSSPNLTSNPAPVPTPVLSNAPAPGYSNKPLGTLSLGMLIGLQ